MLRTGENETEILLGNKQLLGIFFVVAILLGAAFTGGYMLGRGPGGKKSAALPAIDTSAASTATPTNASPGQTHSFPADSPATPASGESVGGGHPPKQAEADTESAGPPLGTPHTRREKVRSTESQQAASVKAESFNPQNGQEYLQVAAVGRDEAEAVADVLHKKGFRAHAVPKPGNMKIYRVIIGPIRDAGDLSSTRDALRRTGFREVIVQRY
ncbi:MAG: SPOR domain-containing protein [Acidobacteriaceae bacterium]|nr:SPOR domain-containing protein [Acidobacteriaceae bacterium]MBV9441461.1 SPOR domain-containing protein [Acidobacteriaceae bacterium]